MELLREFIEEENQPLNVPLMEALSEAVKSLGLVKKGGKLAAKGAGQLFSANPALVIGAAALAVDAYGKYKQNRRKTVRLHAKSAYEKKMMTSIVDALTERGKYKVERIKFEDGGKTWIVKKVS